MRAIDLLNGGLPASAVARRLGVNPRSVQRWKADHRHKGRNALLARPIPGRPRKLSLTTTRQLEDILHRGAPAFGYRTSVWTYPRIARVIYRVLHVRYHADHIGRLLKRLGLHPNNPEHPRGPEASAHRVTGNPSSPIKAARAIGREGHPPIPLEHLKAGSVEGLERGQSLLARSFLPEAASEFYKVYQEAQSSNALLLQAEALWRLGWAQYEQGHYGAAWRRVTESIRLVTRHFGSSLSDLLESAQGQHGSSRHEPALDILCRALHVAGKIRAEQVTYQGAWALAREGDKALEGSLALAMYLDDVSHAGHTQLWQAILRVGAQQDTKHAQRLLDQSADKLRSDNTGQAYLKRGRGLFYYYTGDEVVAERWLRDAAERFVEFGDTRALGPTFHLLSRVALAKLEEEDREAVRYSLAGAVVHPHGFVRDGLERLIRQRAFQSDLRRAVDELFGRRTALFALVHQVATKQVQGTGSTAEDAIEIRVTRLCRLMNQSRSPLQHLIESVARHGGDRYASSTSDAVTSDEPPPDSPSSLAS